MVKGVKIRYRLFQRIQTEFSCFLVVPNFYAKSKCKVRNDQLLSLKPGENSAQSRTLVGVITHPNLVGL